MLNWFPRMHSKSPSPRLRPFIKELWTAESLPGTAGSREHVLPTGQMHLVFRVSGSPLHLYRDRDDASGSIVNEPVVGGPRSSFYIKDTSDRAVTVGVQLLPGAALSLFGVSAAELAGRHTPLSELWGRQSSSALEQIAEAKSPQQMLAQLEALLAARLPREASVHFAVQQALTSTGSVESMVRDSQYSHRGFIALFRQATGFSPKRYARLMRFRALLDPLRDATELSLATLALESGYSDQAHMNREFREFAGITPQQYRSLAPDAAYHVPVKAT